MKKVSAHENLTDEEIEKAKKELALYEKYRSNDMGIAMTHLKAAVDLDYHEAYPTLFLQYKDGKVDWMSEKEIIERLKLSADDGDGRAETLLGLYYMYDQKDEVTGLDFLHRAAFHEESVGTYRLASHYSSKGEIVAMDYLYKAAALGYGEAIKDVAELEKDIGLSE